MTSCGCGLQAQLPFQEEYSAPATMPYTQEPVASLQALYAQLASTTSTQVSAPQATAMLYSAFDAMQGYQFQQPLYTNHQPPANLSASDLETIQPDFSEQSQSGTRGQPSRLSRAHYTPPDLEQSLQSQREQALLEPSVQERLNWSRQYELGMCRQDMLRQDMCRPPSVPLLADPADFGDAGRLDPTQVSFCLFELFPCCMCVPVDQVRHIS